MTRCRETFSAFAGPRLSTHDVPTPRDPPAERSPAPRARAPASAAKDENHAHRRRGAHAPRSVFRGHPVDDENDHRAPRGADRDPAWRRRLAHACIGHGHQKTSRHDHERTRGLHRHDSGSAVAARRQPGIPCHRAAGNHDDHQLNVHCGSATDCRACPGTWMWSLGSGGNCFWMSLPVSR